MARIRIVIRCEEELKWRLLEYMAKEKIHDYEEALQRLLDLAEKVGRRREI